MSWSHSSWYATTCLQAPTRGSVYIYLSIFIDLYPGALLRGGGAAGARIRQATRGTAIVTANLTADRRQAPAVITDRRQAAAVLVGRVIVEGAGGFVPLGMVRAVKVVAVALELGRHVLREEGHVGDAHLGLRLGLGLGFRGHRVDGRMEVDEGRGAVGELQRAAHAGGRGRDRGRSSTCRVRRASCDDLGAGAGHQRVRCVLLSKQLRLQAASHLEGHHLHLGVRVRVAACGAVGSRRLRDPRVAVLGRVEGGRPLKRVLGVCRRACLVEVAVPELGDGGVRAVDHWLRLG
eukprot:scaffold42457_cov68-Phaeocystis_antarctica.AAC.8